MRLPADWTAEQAYDLICNESGVRRIVYGHRCDGEVDG